MKLALDSRTAKPFCAIVQAAVLDSHSNEILGFFDSTHWITCPNEYLCIVDLERHEWLKVAALVNEGNILPLRTVEPGTT